ncbi:DUF4224 domain-containing protein [Ferrovum sp.]|uniref:DUF4224 domain-containing protein n=1 Tax=Ferrovum sp. TaxID=2609467 RepID=UPI00260594D6|nr:DUF4224 domain-containing protein [Ferrovum sp.]
MSGAELAPQCEFLNAVELVALTGKEQPAAQCRALKALGIPFLQRRSVPIVSRVLVQRKMLGEPVRAPRGIDWSTVK